MAVTDETWDRPSGTPELPDQTTSLMVSKGGWNSPSGWTGPPAALYRSFDTSDGLILVEGSSQIEPIPLVTGKVRSIKCLKC